MNSRIFGNRLAAVEAKRQRLQTDLATQKCREEDIVNTFPQERAGHQNRVEQLEAERDAARAGEARAVEACQRIEEALQGTDFADHGLDSPVWNALELVRDVTADKPALDWLAQQRAEAVAAWIEKQVAENLERYGTHYYERTTDDLMREAAAFRAAALQAGEAI